VGTLKAPPIVIEQFLHLRRVTVHDAAFHWDVAEKGSIALPHPLPALHVSSSQFFSLT
jgi:hypothetical protein